MAGRRPSFSPRFRFQCTVHMVLLQPESMAILGAKSPILCKTRTPARNMESIQSTVCQCWIPSFKVVFLILLQRRHSIPVRYSIHSIHSIPFLSSQEYSFQFLHSIPFHSIPFHSIPSIPFIHSIPLHSIPSFPFLHSIPSDPFRSIHSFHSIPFHSIDPFRPFKSSVGGGGNSWNYYRLPAGGRNICWVNTITTIPVHSAIKAAF